MTTASLRCTLATTAFVFVASAVAGAQDCASTPLLGRSVAAGAHVSHSTLGETSFGGSVTGRVVGPVRLGANYQATRLDNVDRLTHEGRVAAAVPVSLASFELCPSVGAGYMHLSTANATTDGQVTTREVRVGGTLGRSFGLDRSVRVTPFVEPMFVRRSVSWESVDASWRVLADENSQETQLWLGVSVARSHNAVVARFRPKLGTDPAEFGVGVVAGLGRR